MENPSNTPPNAALPTELQALEELVAERRKQQGIENPIVAKFKAAMALPPLSAEQEAKLQEEQAEFDRRDRNRRRKKMLDEFLESVGDLHSGCRLHNFECRTPQQEKVHSAIVEYGNSLPERLETREGIVLYGPVGTGKDHLMVSLGGIAVERFDRSVRWLNGQNWLGDVRDAMDSDKAERSLLAEISRPEILILSDPLPPMGGLGQHMATMLYRLFEARDARGRVTWVTINVMSDQEADERMSVPTWDRICDRSWKMFCNWKSHRKPAKVIA